ncbi:MAG: flagellar basal-body rod protein FlgG [Peptococcaceae bacterium]|nr:flagellar basal-body rod protein FlgG [Peptococcaceae bacterium]
MFRALTSGVSGLNAQQVKVDVLANNLANVNTRGFKKSRVNFNELLSKSMMDSGLPVAAENNQIGLGGGVRAANVDRIYDLGHIIETGMMMDLAICGKGFFKVLLPDGEERFTRDGSFRLDQDGSIVTSAGYKLEGIQPTPGADKINVCPDGTVQAQDEGEDTTTVGQIELYMFTNMSKLQAVGENLYSFTGTTAEVLAGKPGLEGFGELRPGFIEMANVELVEEMTNLIEAQRAYGFNTRIVRTADEMWSMANNLRK